MIHTGRDDFILTAQQLEASPSREAGVSRAVEDEQRAYGAQLIATAGCMLDVPPVVTCTAQVLMHRIYCKKSLLRYPIKSVAMACLWLACKLEECPRRIHLFLAVFHRIDQRELQVENPAALNPFSREYEDMKRSLVWHEMSLLRSFGFVCHVDHPHKMILSMLQMLKQPGVDLNGWIQEAWNLLSDSLRTTLCIRFPSEAIACGIVFYSARRLEIPMPETPPWWDVFGVSLADIYEIAHTLQALYEQRTKPVYADLKGEHERKEAALKASAAAAAQAQAQQPTAAAAAASTAAPPAAALPSLTAPRPIVLEGPRPAGEGPSRKSRFVTVTAAAAGEAAVAASTAAPAVAAAAAVTTAPGGTEGAREERRRSRSRSRSRERERERDRDRRTDRRYPRDRDRDHGRKERSRSRDRHRGSGRERERERDPDPASRSDRSRVRDR